MKKVLATFIIIMTMLNLSTSVRADTLFKEVEIALSCSDTVLEVGETIVLTARTQKKGSSYVGRWEGAVEVDTILDTSAESYISSASFTADEPGTYTLTYSVEMEAGKNDAKFVGTAVQVVTVIAAEVVPVITGIEVKNLAVNEVKDVSGQIIGYDVFGETYVLWSNNNVVEYGTIYLYFNANEISRDVDIMVEGKSYTCTVTLVRP